MNDNSTISWMMMGGPRDDEHGQDARHLEHMRALRESRAESSTIRLGGWLTQLAGFLDIRTAPVAQPVNANCCSAA